jgi:hypothetical protein
VLRRRPDDPRPARAATVFSRPRAAGPRPGGRSGTTTITACSDEVKDAPERWSPCSIAPHSSRSGKPRPGSSARSARRGFLGVEIADFVEPSPSGLPEMTPKSRLERTEAAPPPANRAPPRPDHGDFGEPEPIGPSRLGRLWRLSVRTARLVVHATPTTAAHGSIGEFAHNVAVHVTGQDFVTSRSGVPHTALPGDLWQPPTGELE